MPPLVLAVLFAAGSDPAPVRVAPELVCLVQDAIRWRAPAWTERRCRTVARALNQTAEPRDVLSIAVLESGLRADAVAYHHGGAVADVGICGVRCRLGPRRRCVNWPVRGLTVERLKDPSVNIRMAGQVLVEKRRLFGSRAHDRYAGDLDGSSGRASDVRAVLASFAGVELYTKRRRARELARKIAVAARAARKDER